MQPYPSWPRYLCMRWVVLLCTEEEPEEAPGKAVASKGHFQPLIFGLASLGQVALSMSQPWTWESTYTQVHVSKYCMYICRHVHTERETNTRHPLITYSHLPRYYHHYRAQDKHHLPRNNISLRFFKTFYSNTTLLYFTPLTSIGTGEGNRSLFQKGYYYIRSA